MEELLEGLFQSPDLLIWAMASILMGALIAVLIYLLNREFPKGSIVWLCLGVYVNIQANWGYMHTFITPLYPGHYHPPDLQLYAVNFVGFVALIVCWVIFSRLSEKKS